MKVIDAVLVSVFLGIVLIIYSGPVEQPAAMQNSPRPTATNVPRPRPVLTPVPRVYLPVVLR